MQPVFSTGGRGVHGLRQHANKGERQTKKHVFLMLAWKAENQRQFAFLRHSQHVDDCLWKANTVVTDNRETQRILFCQSRNRRVENSKKSDAPLALLFYLLFHPSVKSQCETGRWSPFGPAFACLWLSQAGNAFKGKNQQTWSIRLLLIDERTVHGTFIGSKGAERLKGTVKHVTHRQEAVLSLSLLWGQNEPSALLSQH